MYFFNIQKRYLSQGDDNSDVLTKAKANQILEIEERVLSNENDINPYETLLNAIETYFTDSTLSGKVDLHNILLKNI